MFLFKKRNLVERRAPDPASRFCSIYFDATEVPGSQMSMAEFRFLPGQSGPRHEHESEAEVYYCLEGEGIVVCGEEEFRLSKGAVLYIPPKTPHETRNDGPGEFVFLGIFAPCMDMSGMRAWSPA